MIDFTFSVQL